MRPAHPVNLAILGCALALLVPTAAGELTITYDEGPYDIAPGESKVISFDVTFEAEGFACFQGDQFEVTFESKDTGMPSMPNTPIPAITFDPGQGVFAPPAGQPYSETKTVDVEITVLENAPYGHTMAYNYEARFEGGTTCIGTSQPGADSEAFLWRVNTGADPNPEPTPAQLAAQEAPEQESPIGFLPLAGILVALAMLRRQ